jgi:hypothetical protein
MKIINQVKKTIFNKQTSNYHKLSNIFPETPLSSREINIKLSKLKKELEEIKNKSGFDNTIVYPDKITTKI